MKPLLWILLLLPFAGLAIFSLSAPRDPQVAKPSEKSAMTARNTTAEKKTSATPLSARQFPHGAGSSVRASGEQIVANARAVLEDARASLKGTEEGRDEMRAKMAATTPEQEQAAVEQLLRFRKPHYQALFKSWSVDPEDGEEAIEIIHTRDLKLRGLMNQFAREGTSFAKEYATQRQSAENAAAGQFIAIFGVNRAEELARFEKDPKSFLK